MVRPSRSGVARATRRAWVRCGPSLRLEPPDVPGPGTAGLAERLRGDGGAAAPGSEPSWAARSGAHERPGRGRSDSAGGSARRPLPDPVWRAFPPGGHGDGGGLGGRGRGRDPAVGAVAQLGGSSVCPPRVALCGQRRRQIGAVVVHFPCVQNVRARRPTKGGGETFPTALVRHEAAYWR